MSPWCTMKVQKSVTGQTFSVEPLPFGCSDEKEEEDNAEVNDDEMDDNADDG